MVTAKRIKKISLPPMTLEGLETYLRRKGYRINPILQADKTGALFTFDKPLPDRSRIHGAVFNGRNYFTIKQHIDSSNPYSDPIGHLLADCTTSIRNQISKVPKRKTKK